MTFPTIQTADTKTGTVATNSSSWTLTYPTNLASGDLILAFVAIDGDHVDNTFPAGWSNIYQSSVTGIASLCLGAKISNGTETGTGTFTFGLSATEQGAWRVLRITGWYGSGLPASATVTSQILNGDGFALTAGGSIGSTTVDPHALNPANWDIEDTLWIAAGSVDTSRTITAYPTNMPDNNTADVSGGAGGATLCMATLNSAVATLDPLAFTISSSDDSCNYTIAIRPAAVTTQDISLSLFDQSAATFSPTVTGGVVDSVRHRSRVYPQIIPH